jgi:hypothetical protein
MEKSRGSKKALKAAVTVMALVAALATMGCSGSSLMGPDTTATGQGQVANQGGQHALPGGQHSTPGGGGL